MRHSLKTKCFLYMFYASLQTGVVQLDRCDLFAFNALPEFHRADTLGFAECLREIAQR